MKVAKITLWDGRKFYTDDYSQKNLRAFFDNVRQQLTPPPNGLHNQVDLIEMTQEEYAAVPATVESATLFGKPSGDSQR